jgi:hypothetical protein
LIRERPRDIVRFMEVPMTTRSLSSLALLVALVALITPQPAGAEECLVMESQLIFDTMYSCEATPAIDRFFSASPVVWKGHTYLFGNTGNELKMWLADDPDHPTAIASSDFNVPNVGDSDHDLLNFSMCDDCRYGIASFKGGAVLFDLGTASTPAFYAKQLYGGAVTVAGGLTFRHNGQQYLIASDLPNECSTGDATLYELNGIDSSGLEFVTCVQAPGEPITEVFGGYYVAVPGDDMAYLYLGDRSQDVHLFRLYPVSSSVDLDYLSTPMHAAMLQRSKGLDIDLDTLVAVTANTSGLKVWDLVDPADPVEVGSYATGYVNSVAVHYPFVWVARKGITDSSRTFDISELSSPLPLDTAFWDPSRPWNYPGHACVNPQHAQFSRDGSVLYAARYSVGQMVDFTDCSANIIFSDGFEGGDLTSWSDFLP